MLGCPALDIATKLGCEKQQVHDYVQYFNLHEVRAWQREQQVKEILERYGFLETEGKAA